MRVSSCDATLNRRRTRTARVSEDNLHRNSLHRHTLRESLRRNMDVSTDLDVASLTHERKQSTVEEKKPENEEEEENVSVMTTVLTDLVQTSFCPQMQPCTGQVSASTSSTRYSVN